MFIESAAGLKGDELERELFIVRKLMEKEKAAALGEDHWDFYACTLSNRTIVYKGMLNSAAGAWRRWLLNLGSGRAALWVCKGVLGLAAGGCFVAGWLRPRPPCTCSLTLRVPTQLHAHPFAAFHSSPTAVGPFFKDLTNPAYETPFAIYHRRFSTNTTPKWPLAQPMRVLGHNGALPQLPAGGFGV